MTVKGSKGTLEQTLPGGITVRDDEGTLVVERPDDPDYADFDIRARAQDLTVKLTIQNGVWLVVTYRGLLNGLTAGRVCYDAAKCRLQERGVHDPTSESADAAS